MRTFSVTPARANLVTDLYVSNIKQFKPTPLLQQEIDASVKHFQAPSAPQVPQNDVSALQLSEYEAEPVETQEVDSTGSVAPKEEDWFVFEEEAEEAH